MKRRRLSLVVLAACTAGLGATTRLAAQDTDVTRATLKGLPGVCVVVDGIQPDAERDGLMKAAIQTDVEVQLRVAGIPVLTVEEMLKSVPRPFLRVQINTVSSKARLYAYSVHIGVDQLVLLKNGQRAIATTWAPVSEIGLVESESLRLVRDSVKDRVNEFINAWLMVNPKK